MATPFPFGSGNVLTAAQMNAITTLPINDQTASYVAVVGDVGKRIVMNVATANTVTINNSIFAVGDTIFIANKGAGTSTITAGAGVTINSSGSLALAQHGGGTLVALSASVFTFFSGAGGIKIEYLVVGGGGGTASGYVNRQIGGGGAGGYVSNVQGETTGTGATVLATYAVTQGFAYPVIVGAGGTGNTSGGGIAFTTPAQIGNASLFGDIFALGGGGGGSSSNASTQNGATKGGSGGGGARGGAGGAGTTRQGTAGIAGVDASYGGGGGGAGATGSTSTGGAGIASSITGSSVTRGGGGGGGGGAGGAGGGGSGIGAGTAGTANTGGGGGGTDSISDGQSGLNGGSGVVILRSITPAASTTGSPTVTTSGAYTIYNFTGSGSITF